jgi:hypothetical protein
LATLGNSLAGMSETELIVGCSELATRVALVSGVEAAEADCTSS